jgi:hypothetical protein
MSLVTAANLADPDAAYRMIVEASRGLSEDECASLTAAALLLLANHIGDAQVLKDALALARETARDGSKP